MSLPMPVGHLWVSTVTLPVSRESDEWYGRWFIYDRRPDLEKNAEAHPLSNGVTANFPGGRQAEKATKLREGARRWPCKTDLTPPFGYRAMLAWLLSRSSAMGTTGHAFVHAGHRFQYVLAVGDRSFSADVTCDGKALHHFSSPFNGYESGHSKVGLLHHHTLLSSSRC